MRTAGNLHDALTLDGHTTVVSVGPLTGTTAGPGNVRLVFDAGATQPQKDAAEAFVAAFDWSDAAQADADNLAARTDAVTLTSDPRAGAKLERAGWMVLLAEVNRLWGAMPRYLTSITRSGTTATATTSAAHGLSVGAQVFVSGADAAAYNGLKTVATTPTATTFTYTGVGGNPATPALGSLSFTLAEVPPISRTEAQVRAAIQSRLTGGGADT